jgi:hypothetical protein
LRFRLTVLTAAAVLGLLGVAASAASAASVPGHGAPGIGDPYCPTYGNGGYDVSHYDLDLDYQPATDTLTGTTTVTASTTRALSRFDLDFALSVSKVVVNGRPARFASGAGHGPAITPDRPAPRRCQGASPVHAHTSGRRGSGP